MYKVLSLKATITLYNLAKRINDNHQLQFMATGAPQHHDQRDKGAGLTIADWEMTKRTYGVCG